MAHTFATGFKVEEIENGIRLTVLSPGGDQIFDTHVYNVLNLHDLLANYIAHGSFQLRGFDDDE